MSSLSSDSEFKELDDIIDFFKIILRAIAKPIHYKELSDHLVLDYADIKSFFHSFSDSEKLAFFKDQSKSFKVDTNGLVSCIEDDIIEAFTKLLKCSAPQHFLKVIHATEVAATYFSQASESEKFKFFKDRAQIFIIPNDGYVKLSEKPAKIYKKLFKKSKVQVSPFFKDILTSHGPVYFTWFLDYLEMSPHYKNIIAREPDVEFRLWHFFKSHSLDFIISDLGFVDLPPHLKSKVKEDTFISMKEDEVVGFFVAKLAFFGCLLFPLLLKLLQESALDIRSFFANYFLNEIQEFFMKYSHVFVLPYKTVSLLCTFQHDGFIYFEDDKYPFEDQQEVIFFFLDSLKIECPKHYIYLSQMLEKSDIETDFKHAFVSSSNSVKHWFFKNNPDLFCIGNNGYVSLHSLFKLSDVGKLAVQHFAKKLQVFSTKNFWTLINSAAVSSKEFQNYFANFSPLDKFYFFKKFPSVFNVDFNGYVSCDVVPNLYPEVDVINTLIKKLEVSQPINFEKLCLSVENSSEVAREFFRTYSISQKYKFFKSKPMHFCIKLNGYVYFPNINSELEDKMLNNGIKSDHALANIAYTSTNEISKTNMVQYSPINPYSDSSTASTANTSACVSPGASGSHCGLAVTHSDFLPEGIAVAPTYISSGANSIQYSPTKLLSNSLPANLEETFLLTGSGEKHVQYTPTISSCASSVVSIIEYDISEANSTQCSPSIPCSDSSPVSTSTQLSSKANSEPNSSSVSHSASSSVSVVDVHEYDDLEATDSQHSPIVSNPDSPVIITDTSKYLSSKTSSAQNSPTVSFLDSSSASITDVDEYANLEASDSQYNSIVPSSDSSAVSTGTSIHVGSKASGVQNSSAVPYSDSSFSITDVHEYVDSEASDSQCSSIILSSDSLESYTQSLVNITDTSKQSSCKADGVQNSPTVPYFDFSSVGITDIHECADSEVNDSQRSPVVSNSDSSSVSITDTSKHLSSDTHGTQNISAVSCSDSSSVNLAIVHVNNEVNGTQCNSIMSGSDILHTNSVHAVSEVSDHSGKSVITVINSYSPSTSIVDTLTPVGSETNGESYISTSTYNANVVGKGVMKNESTMLNLDAEYSSANSNLNECTALESKIDDASNGVGIMLQEDTSHAKEQNCDNVNELFTKEELESSNTPKRENNSDCQTQTHLLNTFEEFTNDVSTTKLSKSISPSHNVPSDVDKLEETHGKDQVIKSLTAILKAYKRVHFEKLCTYNEFSSTKFPNYFLVYSANEKYDFFKTREKYFSIDIDGYVSIPGSTLSTSILSPDNVKSHQNEIISTPSIGSTANDEQNQAFTLQNMDDCNAEKLSMPCTTPNNVSSNAEDALNNCLLSSQSNESDFNSSNNNEQLSVKEDDIIMLLKHHLNVHKRMHCLELCEATKQYFTAYSALQKIQFFKDRQQHFCIDNDSYVTLPSDTATQCKSYIRVKSSKDILCGLSSNDDNAVPCDQELPDTIRACISDIPLSIEEADIIDVLKRNLKLSNRMHYLELFSCVEKLNEDLFACLFSFQKLNFFKRYPNHFHVSADNYVSLSESTESSLNSTSIVKDTSIIPFEFKHTSDNDLTTIRSDSYFTPGSERCLNNIVHANSTEEIAEKSKGNSIDTLQHNTVRSLTGHRREIIKTLFDQLKSGKQLHFTQLCKVAEKLNGIAKKFFYSFADNEKREFLMSYPQYFSVDSNGFVTLSKTMKSKVGSFLPCGKSLKTCGPSIYISKDIHSRPVNHNNIKISSMCLTPHNEQSLSSSFQWNSEEEKSESALTTYTSVTAKGISEHPNMKDFLNFFQSILRTADVLHYEELYIELEDSNQFENYKTFFERYGKLKFFEDHSDIFKVYSGGFISLVAEADPKSCPIKDVYTKTTCKETGLVSDNEVNKSFDYTCAYEELSLSHCHMFTVRYFIKALREDQPLHFKQLVKDACVANPDAKSFFILFKTSADLLDFYKLHSMYFTIDDEEMVSLKKSDIMPDEVFSLEMELRNIKSSIISKALEFYVTILKSRENLSVKESENLLQFTSGYVISFFNTNYPGSKIMNFFIDHPDCFLLDDEGKITLRTHEADVGIALGNTCIKCTTIENSSVTNDITQSDVDVSLKFENGGLLKVVKGNEFPPGTQDHAEASLKLPFNEVPSKAQKNTEISSKVWEIVKPLPIVQNDNNGSSKEHSNITKTTDRFSSQSVTSLLPQFVESTSSKDHDQLQENFSDAGCHDIKTTPSQHPPESFLKVPILNHHNDNLKSQGLQLDKDFEFKNKLNDGNYSDHVHRNEKTNADIIVQRRFSESALDLQYLNSVNIARNQHSRQNKVEQQPNASQPKTKPQLCNVDVQNSNAKINLPHQPPVRDALKQLAIIAKTYNPKLEMQCINFFKSIMQEKAPRILHVKFLRAIASKSPDAIRTYLLHYCQRDFSLFFYLHLDHFLINRLGYVALRITSNRTGCDDKLEIKAANFFTPLIHFVFKGKVSCDVLERCLHFASEEVQLYLERTYKTNLKLFFYNNVDHFDIDIFDVVSLKN